MASVSQVMARALWDAGVRVVYGLPGGRNVVPLDELRQAGIEFVLVRNENSAVFMAAAQARLTGQPGVVLITLGPGAANAYAAVAHAHLDRSPVLIITAQTEAALDGVHTHQVIDLQACFRPITKRTVYVTSETASRDVLEGLALTQQGRPGPVHLGLSAEVATSEAPEGGGASLPAAQVASVFPSELDRAKRALAAARRPLILAGVGLEPEGPYAELLTLAGSVGAPVVVTPKVKGAIPGDHPLAAGTIGLTRVDPVYDLVSEADLYIAVGFDVVELVMAWDVEAPLIWLAPWANADPIIAAETELVGEMGPALAELSRVEVDADPLWGAGRVAEFHRRYAWASPSPPPAGRLWPQQVLSALRRSIRRDTLITTDIGSHKIMTALEWPAYAPNRYWVSNGLSCMGSSLPAAMAAAQTLGEPVVCLTGDGGLSMVVGELGLLVERQWPVIIVVMNDGALDLIRAGQQRRGLPPLGTEFVNPDHRLIAAAYRIPFHRATSEQEMAEAVSLAMASGRPALIEAMIDPHTYPTHVSGGE